MGRRAATLSDFGRYTDALKKSEIVWDETTLYAWIKDPQVMVPGTTMTFRGIENGETREDASPFSGWRWRQMVRQGCKGGLLPAGMAQEQITADLSTVGPNQRITEIRHCGDGYHVTTADGARFPFWETNVRSRSTPARAGRDRENRSCIGRGW